MSRILSPNPLVITITVNEVTGAISAQASKPTPHITLVGIYGQLIVATASDAVQAASKIPLQNPGENTGGNSGGQN